MGLNTNDALKILPKTRALFSVYDNIFRFWFTDWPLSACKIARTWQDCRHLCKIALKHWHGRLRKFICTNRLIGFFMKNAIKLVLCACICGDIDAYATLCVHACKYLVVVAHCTLTIHSCPYTSPSHPILWSVFMNSIVLFWQFFCIFSFFGCFFKTLMCFASCCAVWNCWLIWQISQIL